MQLEDNVLTLTVIPNISTSGNSDSHIPLLNAKVDENQHSLNQFFRSPVQLIEGQINLKQDKIISVVKGNDKNDDLVSPGTTKFSYIEKVIPLAITQKYNNTFVDAQPTSALVAGEYIYRVGTMINPTTETIFSLNDSYTFTVENNNLADFNINDIRLDNNDGRFENKIIVAENTAGQVSTQGKYSYDSYLYFPESIKSLEFLELIKINEVEDNNSTDTYDSRTLIKNGNFSVLSKVHTFSTATNETIDREVNGIQLYTHLENQTWYYLSYFNTPRYDLEPETNVNTATFNYIYKVKGSDEVKTGTITLKVE